jgi:hypothetical protein
MAEKYIKRLNEREKNNLPGWRVGLYFYSPILNSTRIWWVGEWLCAPLPGPYKQEMWIFILTAMHCRLTQVCFMRPGPPNLRMSLQNTHSPHSVRVQGSHFLQRVRRRRIVEEEALDPAEPLGALGGRPGPEPMALRCFIFCYNIQKDKCSTLHEGQLTCWDLRRMTSPENNMSLKAVRL